MQGRKFDGDTRAFIDASPGRSLADRMDGVLVINIITLGVRGRGRRFAEHVIGIAEAAGFQRPRALQRLVDGFAGDELLAHHPHRHVDAAADHRLAGPGDQAGECGGQAAVVDGGSQLARDDQTPGGSIDEEGAATADM